MSESNPPTSHDDPSAEQEAAEYREKLNESARLLYANRPGEAAAILEALQEKHPRDPDIAINLGGALILQRKWDEAVKVLQKALEANPENVMLWTNLAAAHLGRLETSGPTHQQKAIEAYEQALRLDPSAPNVHYHLGLIYKEQGNLSRAAALFQRALEVNPDDKDAKYWMDKLSALLVEQQRKKREQAEAADQSADSTPSDSDQEDES